MAPSRELIKVFPSSVNLSKPSLCNVLAPEYNLLVPSDNVLIPLKILSELVARVLEPDFKVAIPVASFLPLDSNKEVPLAKVLLPS